MRLYVAIFVGLTLGVAIGTIGQPAQAQQTPHYAFPMDEVGSQPNRVHRGGPNGHHEEGLAVDESGMSMNGSCDCQDGSCMNGSCDCQDGSCMNGSCDCQDGSCMNGSCGCEDGYCGCEPGCCDCGGGCGCSYCGGPPACDPLIGPLCRTRCFGRYYVGADYLYVRANVSQAMAYVVEETSEAGGIDEFHELDFRHESSYRLRGGFELGSCGEELRYTFTRLNSYAHTVIPYADNIFVPYAVDPPVDGQTIADADVDLKSYDLELAKVIPLGSAMGGECGDPCGCGTCYGGCDCCPAWDITWTGGLRFADADWRRTFVALEEDGTTIDSQAATVMNFEGGGVRLGLEGRRYLGCAGMFSVFLRGDLSLLLGHVDLRTEVRETAQPTDVVIVQTTNSRSVIPVTEIEGGITAQLTCYTQLTTGYMFGAWHDLGVRDDTTCLDTVLNLGAGYDDANILAFDGMFVRLETNF